MLRKFSFLFLTTAFLLSGSVAAADEWKEFAPAGGKCSILMPGTDVRYEKQAVPHVAGNVSFSVEYQIYTVYLPQRQRAFRIAYADLSKDIVGKVGKARVLDVVRDMDAKVVNGKLRDERTIALQGNEGREFFVDWPNGLTLAYRIYLVNERLYEISGLAQKTDISSSDFRKFHDSFKLLQEPLTGILPPKEQWKEIISNDGRFAVLMPGIPKREKDITQTPSGLAAHRLAWEIEGVLIVTVEFTDLSAPPADSSKLLDLLRDTALKTVKGKLRSERPISLNLQPGKEIVVDDMDFVFKHRFYVVKNRLYDIGALVIRSQEQNLAADVQRFFDSFRLTN